MQVKDKMDLDRTSGALYLDDRLYVTASDGQTENIYYLAMLERTVDYLAYVLSDVYVVDQVNLSITGDPTTDINGKTLVSDFLANLDPAPGATVKVLDAEMNEKAGTDDMDEGDIVEVLAGNGVTVVYYTVAVDVTSAQNEISNSISIYPNPSTGMIHVDGIEQGNRVQVYNALGARVIDNVAQDNMNIINLEDPGMYFMVISNKDGVVGQYKLIVK